jgi:imidazolonepropionase-like amidohydrolase
MFAITNAVVDPVAHPRVEGATVLVKDGRIAAVGAKVRLPAEACCIDAGGRLLTPGLMDAHCHAGLAEDGMIGDSDVNEKTEPVTAQVRALDAFRPTDVALLEAAQSGVTSIFVTPGSANVICGLGAVVKTLGKSFDRQLVKPDAGLKMATGENPKRVYGGMNKMPSTRMGTAAVIRAALTRAQVYAQKKQRHAQKKASSKEPFELDCELEALAGLLAKRYPARCHAHRSVDMLTAMRLAEQFGFELVFEHATECEDILPELTARSIPVVIGPTLGSRGKIELHHKRFSTVAAAVDAGLTVAITADHSVTPLRYLNVYAALAIREGLDPQAALRCVTLNPARICGVDDRLGSIEKGKDADLVLWDGDPFDIRTKPAAVWINGEPVDLTIEPFRRQW